MRPIDLRTCLQRIVAGSLFLFAFPVAAAAWIALSQPEYSAEAPAAWAIAFCLVCAVALPFLHVQARAKELADAIASLESVAKSMVSGQEAKLPEASEPLELALVAEKLVHAANVVRGREFALRSADRVKDEFLAMLAHELRNPLSAMSAAAYLLRKTARDGASAQPAAVIDRQVQQMNRLIEDLLDVARITRGKVSLSRQPLDLARAVEKAVSELRLAGRLDEHELSLEVAEAWVRADEARLQQLITNLVGNAVKYTPAGGRIAVTVRRDRDEAILRVQDSGVGMPPELAARVFDLFVQGEASRRRGGGGLGIGLALVKHLAELHGGKAFAASGGTGQGSVFTVTLPAIEAQPQAQAGAVVTAPAQSPHRILLVDGNDDARGSMFAALELQGHRVYEAADVRDGIRAVETVRPDVAIVDVGLSRPEGFEMATALRESPERGDMVLIAMTALERPETVRRAREAGFDEYVTKPVPPDRLVRLIDAAIVARAQRGRGQRPVSISTP
ncbi:MAG TPA: hybrid sensor histidine kinase/response regulator [Burkholderiales bacterium]|nr:hybrid sensor histidine kinase/response regulator [Burkholderiales bacterium]